MNIEDSQFLRNFVPETFKEAVKDFGSEVVNCEPHEWDNRPAEHNAVWLIIRLAKVLEQTEEKIRLLLPVAKAAKDWKHAPDSVMWIKAEDAICEALAALEAAEVKL